MAVRAGAWRFVLDAGRAGCLGRMGAHRRDAQRHQHVRAAHPDVRRPDPVDADAVRSRSWQRRVSDRSDRIAHVALGPVAHGIVPEPDGSGRLDAVDRHGIAMQRSEHLRDAVAAVVLVASASCATDLSGWFVATGNMGSCDVSRLDVQSVGAVSHATTATTEHLSVLQRQRVDALHEHRDAAADGRTARTRRPLCRRLRQIDVRHKRAVRVHDAERLVNRMVRHQRRAGCVRMRA
jgi:hypothetical protein